MLKINLHEIHKVNNGTKIANSRILSKLASDQDAVDFSFISIYVKSAVSTPSDLTIFLRLSISSFDGL